MALIKTNIGLPEWHQYWLSWSRFRWTQQNILSRPKFRVAECRNAREKTTGLFHHQPHRVSRHKLIIQWSGPSYGRFIWIFSFCLRLSHPATCDLSSTLRPINCDCLAFLIAQQQLAKVICKCLLLIQQRSLTMNAPSRTTRSAFGHCQREWTATWLFRKKNPFTRTQRTVYALRSDGERRMQAKKTRNNRGCNWKVISKLHRKSALHNRMALTLLGKLLCLLRPFHFCGSNFYWSFDAEDKNWN